MSAMAALDIRPAALGDLPALTDIYNHYVATTSITFDLHPFTVEARRAWFDAHPPGGRHRLLVATDPAGLLGYASTSAFRAKAAYDTTVEASIYLRPTASGRGVGRALYGALFEAIAGEDIHRIAAGITMPNPASVALHERFGFGPVGVFSEVGRKFGQYWDVAWYERPLRI